jgi:beta-glucosidase
MTAADQEKKPTEKMSWKDIWRWLWCLGDRQCIADMRKFAFPADFVWGTGTSAYQVEGAWNLDGKGESIWDRFSHTPGMIKNGDTGDVACDHYHRLAQDVELARRLNLNSYRFSIAWPRVQPRGRGAFNSAGLDYYDRLIDNLLQAGIEPFVTLYHWDLPQALQQELGGWAHRDVCRYFADYAARCAQRYSDRVRSWTTFNEPWCTSFLGYQIGYHAPGVKDERTAAQVAHHLLVSHGMGMQALRAAARADIEAGIVLNLTITEPLRPDVKEDVELARKAWRWDCGSYLDPLFRGHYSQEVADRIADLRPGDLKLISQPMDFLGINYYSRNVVSAQEAPIHPIPGVDYTAMGWEVSPRALRSLLNRISREYPEAPSLYVSENGAAYDDVVVDTANGAGAGRKSVNDVKRLAYFREHIKQVALAMQDGVDVRGYFAWSLMDNFEWAEGYSRRFGLVHVDFDDPKLPRLVKASGEWFAALAAANKIEIED